ncbi:hypothetical protein L1987_80037 [Smallanthus sonchifolius]|uniref:Uncharacterized protein n=1 Tax=Smallanthus sonchifolius TaxID=185202 RepID=A0ACB8YKV8_9ASTR|nr:hypothetical protein L1987_80037 [Smallanthus sonchifolius]
MTLSSGTGLMKKKLSLSLPPRIAFVTATCSVVLLVVAFVTGVVIISLTIKSLLNPLLYFHLSAIKFNFDVQSLSQLKLQLSYVAIRWNSNGADEYCCCCKEYNLQQHDKYRSASQASSKLCTALQAVLDGYRASLLRYIYISIQGAARVRLLYPDQFCRQNFVMGKASEAGFGNEMYKIITAAALSIMLNRSLIIGQTRGKYPFGDYITYANFSFTLREVKHLWKKNDCVGKYGRHLIIRVDDFEKLSETNVLCSNWRKWKQPIIWFKGTTDAVAAQFFLKNIHVQMKKSASALFGNTEVLRSRPNVVGELLRVMISPSPNVQKAVDSVINGGQDPHLAVHMRMLMNRSVRAVNAVLNCIKTTIAGIHQPRVVLVSDTPSLVNDLMPKLHEFTEVLHFEYKKFKGNISGGSAVAASGVEFRAKDWGPAPRWVAFVDFFLASRATHTVITGAQRRVGTTYAQLIAALAASYQLDQDHGGPANFSFISSFQNNLLRGGLQNQPTSRSLWIKDSYNVKTTLLQVD